VIRINVHRLHFSRVSVKVAEADDILTCHCQKKSSLFDAFFISTRLESRGPGLDLPLRVMALAHLLDCSNVHSPN
jgi:hypothetical protein